MEVLGIKRGFLTKNILFLLDELSTIEQNYHVIINK